jgi:hypothetical protein
VDDIQFSIQMSTITEEGPSGYLFLCPARDLQTRSSSSRCPDCPAYWSIDPAGIERLSTKEATCLGFPCIELTVDGRVHSWDAGVYAGLRQFHEGKGFDPDSHDVACHLGEPLFQLSAEKDPSFAYGELTQLLKNSSCSV